jgi:hypothetical protein
MSRRILTIVVFIAQAGLAQQFASAQKGGACVDPSIQWTINSMYVDGVTPSAIQGDGTPYTDGSSGVAAVINVCSGSYDATLHLTKGRTVSFSFAKLLASNQNTPSWAVNGSTVSGSGDFNVRNIYFVPSGSNRNQEYTFTTRLGSTTPASGSPNLTMTNPSPDAPSSVPNLLAIANVPYNDSLVIVHHCAANTNTASCPNVVHETWFVYPDRNPTASGTGQTGLPITQVGTLVTTSHNGTQVNAGEFSLPFSFVISLVN